VVQRAVPVLAGVDDDDQSRQRLARLGLDREVEDRFERAAGDDGARLDDLLRVAAFAEEEAFEAHIPGPRRDAAAGGGLLEDEVRQRRDVARRREFDGPRDDQAELHHGFDGGGEPHLGVSVADAAADRWLGLFGWRLRGVGGGRRVVKVKGHRRQRVVDEVGGQPALRQV